MKDRELPAGAGARRSIGARAPRTLFWESPAFCRKLKRCGKARWGSIPRLSSYSLPPYYLMSPKACQAGEGSNPEEKYPRVFRLRLHGSSVRISGGLHPIFSARKMI